MRWLATTSRVYNSVGNSYDDLCAQAIISDLTVLLRFCVNPGTLYIQFFIVASFFYYMYNAQSTI